jgi:DNA-directed RNA polymerase specialized sigma24 family protein
MGLFIAAGTSSEIDGGVLSTENFGSISGLANDLINQSEGSSTVNQSRLDSIRKHQADVIEILNIGEAINSRDFHERCAEDSNLTRLSFEATERMQQEIEVADFISGLPQELAELVGLLDEGLTTRDIAKIKGVAKGTIQYRIEKLRSITRAYFACAMAA